MNPIVYAIPGFFVLILVELLVTVVRKKDYYRLNDAVNSLSCGMLNATINLLVRVGVYSIVFHHLALWEMESSAWWVWLLALALQDFFYYWYHRKAHEMNILWAAHAVHHQSEEYNLTTALRQTSTGFLFSWIFYLPMAILGIPPEVFVAVSLVNLLYQFWVHTRHIPKLGWYEWIFVTPSNHRVHHAKNRRYLDKNYGGLFIIWDRLFGTFVEEDDQYEPIRYGTLKPLRSWNPLWANLQVYGGMFADALQTSSWKEKLTLWFRKTGYRPKDVASPMKMPDIHGYQNYDPGINSSLKIYIVVQFMALLVGTTFLIGISHLVSYAFLLFWTTVLGINLIGVGALMERQHLLWLLEALRFVIATAALLMSDIFGVVAPLWVLVSVLVWSTVSVCMLKLMAERHPPESSNPEPRAS